MKTPILAVIPLLAFAALPIGCRTHPERAEAVPQLLREGKAAFEAGEWGRGEALFSKAVELEPSNEAAKRQLHDVRLALGEEPVRLTRDQLRGFEELYSRGRADKAEIRARYELGLFAVMARQFGGAVECFTFVTASKEFPYNIEVIQLQNCARKWLRDLNDLKNWQDREVRRIGERMMEDSARKEERRRREQLARAIQRDFELAELALRGSRFDQANIYCADVLDLDPDRFKWEEMWTLLDDARLDHEHTKIAVERLEELRVQSKIAHPLPGEGELRRHAPADSQPRRPLDYGILPNERRSMPSRVCGISVERLVEVDNEVREKLRDTTIEAKFAAAPLTDVVTCLREHTRINLIIDESSVEQPESLKVTLSSSLRTAEDILDRLAAQCGLQYLIDEGTVILTKRR